MKVCPNCSLLNEERFPFCVMCNAPLMDAPSIPVADPDHPENRQRTNADTHRKVMNRELRVAVLLYASVITVTAVTPGLILSLRVLMLYLGVGLLVGFLLRRGVVGHFLGSLVQGMGSITLILLFGPMHPLIFVMIAAHVIAPMVFGYWMDLIQSAHR